jgi:hypothetical protein
LNSSNLRVKANDEKRPKKKRNWKNAEKVLTKDKTEVV